MKSCHHCHRELSVPAKVERESSCPHCFSDLKCCLNCRFHDRGAHNQCREPQAEWCAEKAKANFCEFFEFADAGGAGANAPRADGAGARAAFDALFRKG